MAQPSIPGIAVGIPRMVYGNDGTNWIAVLVDALGHIQADILSTVLPTDAATQTTLASCLTALQLIDDLRNALGSVNTDDLQVDVKTSALPTDAAKETKQDTMITALQLIDDLRNALGSVNTDDLQVDVKTTVPPVPTSPISSCSPVNVSPSTWTDLMFYTVTAGKTLYFNYWSASPSADVAGFAFITRLTIDDVVKDYAHAPAGGSIHIGLPSPIKATAGQVVAVEGYHAEAGAEWLSASIVGFEV